MRLASTAKLVTQRYMRNYVKYAIPTRYFHSSRFLSAENKSESAEDSKGPVNWKTVGITFAVGSGLLLWYAQMKQNKIEKLKQTRKEVGQPAIGGPFHLVDFNGNEVTDKDFRGKFMLLYFGFTFCPDVCPEELNKMTEAMNILEKKLSSSSEKVVPVFISVDPERDSTKQMKEYLKDFHPRFVGLTGDPAAVEQVAKAYRVFYSKDRSSSSEDYLIDHSIITYLIGPDGNFVTFFGKNTTADEMAKKIGEYL
eukprot:jgi/Galph1/1766/GphlegSOOS_G438.1